MSAPKPEWIDDYGEVVRLAMWLPKSSGWEDMSDVDKLAELLHFLGKPWNYDAEYRLMTHASFTCDDCDSVFACETEEQREAVEAGEVLRCADCDEMRAAEAKAEAFEMELEARAEMDGEP